MECSSETCKEHAKTTLELQSMAQKLTVVESNTSTVNKLSARVSMLIAMMSFGTVLISSTCIYMFTGLSDFKQMYNSHRISTQQQLYSLQKENMEVLVTEIRTLERTLDNKLHTLSVRITKLETTVARNGDGG